MSEALSLALLAAVLAVTVTRPRRVPEVAAAVAAALVLLAAGAISPADVRAEARDLGPTIGFLAAVLVIGALARREGQPRPRLHLYACGHRSNSASLLLPVPDLTNRSPSPPWTSPSPGSPR